MFFFFFLKMKYIMKTIVNIYIPLFDNNVLYEINDNNVLFSGLMRVIEFIII